MSERDPLNRVGLHLEFDVPYDETPQFVSDTMHVLTEQSIRIAGIEVGKVPEPPTEPVYKPGFVEWREFEGNKVAIITPATLGYFTSRSTTAEVGERFGGLICKAGQTNELLRPHMWIDPETGLVTGILAQHSQAVLQLLRHHKVDIKHVDSSRVDKFEKYIDRMVLQKI